MKLFKLATTFLLSLLAATHSAAQCLTPDGLDPSTVACGGAFTQVPQRGFQQSAIGICWRDCGVDAQANYTALWGALNPIVGPPGAISCGWYRGRVRLYLGSVLQWDGQMHFSYSRTWTEAGTAGAPIQVWRYLVNGDMRPVTNNPMPCGPIPCAAPNGNLVRFTGYVDYAADCGTTLTERAWMLTHACDSIDHAPGFPRAGVYHPNRYYTFVGPATGFAVAAGSSPEVGPIAQDCMRKWDALALPARCGAEEPLVGGTLNPVGAVCMCGSGPSNWHEANLFVGGIYGSIVQPFPGSDPFRSFQIGMWTNPAVFPGVEELRYNCNEGQWIDCFGVGRNEYYFGVTTHGGFPAFVLDATNPPVPLGTMFIDQSNSVVLPANIATRNRPYRSDHILNLNL
ncbi:MAG: hypothetical protein IT454_06080 [Planctomycetes bacterium]|nr:hypothetical protein [Planctomycetota bacterium]